MRRAGRLLGGVPKQWAQTGRIREALPPGVHLNRAARAGDCDEAVSRGGRLPLHEDGTEVYFRKHAVRDAFSSKWTAWK